MGKIRFRDPGYGMGKIRMVSGINIPDPQYRRRHPSVSSQVPFASSFLPPEEIPSASFPCLPLSLSRYSFYYFSSSSFCFLYQLSSFFPSPFSLAASSPGLSRAFSSKLTPPSPVPQTSTNSHLPSELPPPPSRWWPPLPPPPQHPNSPLLSS
jgi:hypothetical protein